MGRRTGGYDSADRLCATFDTITSELAATRDPIATARARIWDVTRANRALIANILTD